MSGIYTMMTLGGFQFGVLTAAYEELKRKTEYLWPSQQRFGGAPAVQSVGLGDETMQLPGVVYPAWNGGTGQIDQLRALADSRLPLSMIDGRGNMLGRWVIESVEETQSVFAQAGVARKQQFSLSLKKFGDIEPAGLLAIEGLADKLPIPASVTALPAISGNLSPLSSAADMLASVTGTANAALASAGRITGLLGGSLANVGQITSALGIHSPTITTALNRGLNIANAVRTSSSGGLDLLRRVQTASSAASAARTLFDDVSVLVQPATNAGNSIKSSLGALTGAGAAGDVLATVKGALVSANRVTSLVSSLRDNTNTILARIGA